MELFTAKYRWDNPIRSLGVRRNDLVTADGHIQIDLFDNSKANAETLAVTIDNLHKRFGHNIIQRCAMLLDQELSGFNPKDDHVMHPVSYFK
jgi:DNA polymerase-4